MLEKASRKRGEDYIRRMEEGFYKTSQAVQERLAVWYQRFADNNGISLMEAKKRLTRREMKELRWTVEEYIKAAKENELDGRWIKELENASARAHITRLEAVQLQMQQQAELLYQNQLDGLDRMLRETYREGYYHAAFELQKGFGVGWDLSGIDSGKLEKVLYAPWTADGLTFRDRCWRDKQGLIASLNQHLVQGCIRGETPREAMQDIARQFGVSRSKASRLIMTENAYFHEASQKDCYRDLGVEQIEIVETLDKYTCEICQEMDRKILPLEDDRPGETTPPFHPWCRGCTCPYFEDLGGERAARGEDGKTYYVPADMTYPEWKKGFVEGEKDRLTEVFQPMENYRQKDGGFDLEAAKADYRKFLQSVPEKNRIYLEQALEAVGFEEAKLKASAFGYTVKKDAILYDPTKLEFFDYDFQVVTTHELAHRVDNFFVNSEENEDFLKVIQEGKHLILTHQKELISFCDEFDGEGCFSDVLSAVCQDEVRFPFYHEKEYWMKPGNQQKEIFANLFSLETFQDKEKLSFLERYFPGLVDIYQKLF